VTHKRLAQAVAALALAGVAVAGLVFFPVGRWVETFLGWVRGLGALGGLIYGLVYVAGTVFLVPGTALTAGAGLLYGTLIGVLIVSPASVAGATIAFLVARYFARGWVEAKIAKYPKFAAIDRAVESSGFRVILLLRLQPVFLPFAVLNYALGLTRVRLRDYVLGSWLGMLPATTLYVYLGSAIHNVSDLVQGRLPDTGMAGRILFWAGLLSLGLLVLLLGKLARKILSNEIGRVPERESA
jgi:uncharacterized membrane protein YdjX (TVP38/TMEM64 family)